MSNQSIDCLTNIIGLSRSTCECFDDNKPSDYNYSDSGIYLDELEGLRLKMADAASDCENGGLWNILKTAKNNALINFKSDIMTMLMEGLKQKRDPYRGTIGQNEFRNTITLNNSFAGVRIYCANIISGVMRIHRIGLVMDGQGTFLVSVYKNLNEDAIQSYTINSTGNKLQWYDLPSPLDLSMNDDEGPDNPQYYILYERISGINPKDIRASCGCSGNHYKYYWDLRKPYFKSYEKYRWSEFIMYTGTNGDNLTSRDSWSTNQYLNGLIIDVEFLCKTSELICKQGLNYESNPLALAMAYAIRYRAGAIVADEIIGSSNINRLTMMDRESLSGKRNNYLKEYKDRVTWIAKEMNWKANDCLTCNDFDDVLKVGIFS